MTVAQFAQALQITVRRQIDAALALNRFDEDGAGFAIDEAGCGIEIAIGSEAETGQQRFQTLMILRLSRGTERSQRSPVKAVEHADNLVATGFAVQAGNLDGCLVGFSAAVTEKTLSAPAGPFA